MKARTKRASVSEDRTLINKRVPQIVIVDPTESEEAAETGTSSGAEEDTMNRNRNTKGKGLREETELLKPSNMLFPTTQYNKGIKIETRCSILKTIQTLKRVLNEKELKWFHDHPQFKHFFNILSSSI